MASESERLGEAAAFLADRFGTAPRRGLVLGSGLVGFAAGLEDRRELAFAEVPHWPAPRVEGHGQTLALGSHGGVQVACLTGRVHLYEGWSVADAVRAVRTLRAWGVEDFVLTNAAGGIDPSFRPGDLMVITDHLNLTGTNAMLGPADPALGPRFPDQTALYAPELRSALHAADDALRQGVYAGLLGPTYETPAEVRMLRAMGADAVGMSTVHEASALSAMGARVAGVSLISNAAAGVGNAPLHHEEVVAEGKRAAARFTRLLQQFLLRTSA